jgi:hypothetical protein
MNLRQKCVEATKARLSARTPAKSRPAVSVSMQPTVDVRKVVPGKGLKSVSFTPVPPFAPPFVEHDFTVSISVLPPSYDLSARVFFLRGN